MNNLFKKLIPKSKKYRRRFVVGGIVGLIVVLCLVAANASLFARSIVLNAALDEPYKRFDSYKNGASNYPSQEREAFLNKQLKSVVKAYSNLQKYPLFLDEISQKNSQGVSSLKFKEALFSVKTELRESARARNITIARDIGFAEWEKKLPPREKLPDLFQALDTIRDLGMLALDAGVKEIKKIYVPELEAISFEQGGNRKKYYTRTIDVEVLGDSAQIMRYLQELHASKFLYVVRQCSLSSRQMDLPDSGETKNKQQELSRAKRPQKIVMKISLDQILF